MTKVLLAFGVASVALSATPSWAFRHYSATTQCTRFRHGTCAAWNRLTRGGAEPRAYGVGHMFGPSYQYVDVGALPQPVVTRYHLRLNYRYVNENGYVYVVSPHSFRVVRVIPNL